MKLFISPTWQSWHCTALRIPKPNSALSSKSELAHAGPVHGWLDGYGMPSRNRRLWPYLPFLISVQDFESSLTIAICLKPVGRLPPAFTLGIHSVGEGWVGAAPNGGAARGVGNDQTLPEQLSHQLHVRCLSTTLAGTTFSKGHGFL